MTTRAPAKRDTGWRPPPAARLGAIRERLRGFYGLPVPKPHHDPVAELVLTVLSQNTNDRNRDIAYSRLIERWPTWEAARAAPVEEIEAAIAPGGISKIKSARIKKILDQVAEDNGGRIELDWMATAPVEQSRDYLCTLPGVARKTAACVLLFAYGLPDIPVDTHVGRVGTRLGLFRPGASFEEMHDTLLEITAPALAHETHVNLIRHGRRLCHARVPQCGECPLRTICPSARV
ncbi:MAG TPA: endonuclease III [Solirubrobacterales bacterium]|nr:endonuclease III [Solirubrobacterales bacterium]